MKSRLELLEGLYQGIINIEKADFDEQKALGEDVSKHIYSHAVNENLNECLEYVQNHLYDSYLDYVESNDSIETLYHNNNHPFAYAFLLTNSSYNVSFSQWIHTFLDEKEIAIPSIFEVKDEYGTFHMIDKQVLINSILSCSQKEQDQIKDMMIRIDFNNWDIIHFLNHLALAYADSTIMCG